jgi:hypothetical protein
MRLALSWGIQASHEMPLPIYPVSFETPFTATLSRLFCTTKGWHVDVSFPGEGSDPNDFSTWRINIYSRDRALLMLFLFSDVGENDAPTRIRVGSHREVARMLAPAGEAGLVSLDLGNTADCLEDTATGAAGTVYLCHPFLVHAAQVNQGYEPR